ncbi:MAG TPA: TIR domain-containing protein [Pyrinomonadaceae bacterium]|nr:TIR domain-containing protein [Pyrinomonadaceae bacterium]
MITFITQNTNSDVVRHTTRGAKMNSPATGIGSSLLRLAWLTFSASLFVLTCGSSRDISAQSLNVVSWNIESGDSDDRVISARMARFQGIDLWGLSEVAGADSADIFELGAEGGEGANFESIVGTTGGNDRLVIIYDADRFQKVSHEELHIINPEGRYRAPLVAHFRERPTGREFLFMVNHLNRSSQEVRHRQAKQLNGWAQVQTLPAIAVGDYNFDWGVADGDQHHDLGYDAMTDGGIWTWVRPAVLARTQCSFDTILDFVFVNTLARGWDGQSQIIVEPGDCDESRQRSDHRPLLAIFNMVGGGPAGPPTTESSRKFEEITGLPATPSQQPSPGKGPPRGEPSSTTSPEPSRIPAQESPPSPGAKAEAAWFWVLAVLGILVTIYALLLLILFVCAPRTVKGATGRLGFALITSQNIFEWFRGLIRGLLGRTANSRPKETNRFQAVDKGQQPQTVPPHGDSKKTGPVDKNIPEPPPPAPVGLPASGPPQTETSRPLRAFLCHGASDKEAVRALYHRLLSAGVDPWLDEEKLIPGQRWEEEIPKAVRNSDVVLVCLSRASVNRRGFVQKEIRYALRVADEQPEGTIYIIPVRLEDCEIPAGLSHLHWVNYYEDKGYERLLLALQVSAGKLPGVTVGTKDSPRSA